VSGAAGKTREPGRLRRARWLREWRRGYNDAAGHWSFDENAWPVDDAAYLSGYVAAMHDERIGYPGFVCNPCAPDCQRVSADIFDKNKKSS